MTTVRDRLLALAEDPRPGLRWLEDGTVRELSWSETVAAGARLAADLEAGLDDTRPPHVGVLLPNGPAMALHLVAAGLGGHVLVGLNSTRRGQALADDVAKADCQFVVDTPDRAMAALESGDDGVRVAGVVPDEESLFMLVFTSGTGGSPKAVRVTHQKVTTPGAYLTDKLGLTGDDVVLCAMPLFHSNGVMAGFAPALHTGATFCVAPFSASGFIEMARAFGATYANYVGKPLTHVLATEPRADDRDNPLRLLFGNEAGARDVAAFAERFGVRVVDGFGSSENAVVISRTPDTPPGALGRPQPGVAVLDPETRQECPPASYDEHGRVTNLADCVGELVNTSGAGQFAGYYNDDEATAERMRGGMYWSGDLGYRDPGGFIWFAGRTSDWLRVDGENIAAAPVEAILLRHPAVSEAAVYALPDESCGDQLTAALVLRAPMTPAEFGDFLAAQADLGTKQWPRHVRLLEELPRTATSKVLKRDLRDQGLPGGDSWSRGERDRSYR